MRKENYMKFFIKNFIMSLFFMVVIDFVLINRLNYRSFGDLALDIITSIIISLGIALGLMVVQKNPEIYKKIKDMIK